MNSYQNTTSSIEKIKKLNKEIPELEKEINKIKEKYKGQKGRTSKIKIHKEIKATKKENNQKKNYKTKKPKDENTQKY